MQVSFWWRWKKGLTESATRRESCRARIVIESSESSAYTYTFEGATYTYIYVYTYVYTSTIEWHSGGKEEKEASFEKVTINGKRMSANLARSFSVHSMGPLSRWIVLINCQRHSPLGRPAYIPFSLLPYSRRINERNSEIELQDECCFWRNSIFFFPTSQ